MSQKNRKEICSFVFRLFFLSAFCSPYARCASFFMLHLLFGKNTVQWWRSDKYTFLLTSVVHSKRIVSLKYCFVVVVVCNSALDIKYVQIFTVAVFWSIFRFFSLNHSSTLNITIHLRWCQTVTLCFCGCVCVFICFRHSVFRLLNYFTLAKINYYSDSVLSYHFTVGSFFTSFY